MSSKDTQLISSDLALMLLAKNGQTPPCCFVARLPSGTFLWFNSSTVTSLFIGSRDTFTCSLFSFWNLWDRWEYPRKMERHFPIKPDQPIGIAFAIFVFFFFPNSLIRAKNGFVKKGTANFGRNIPTELSRPPPEVILNIPVFPFDLRHNGKHPGLHRVPTIANAQSLTLSTLRNATFLTNPLRSKTELQENTRETWREFGNTGFCSFSRGRKRFENGVFRNRWRHDNHGTSMIKFSITFANPKWYSDCCVLTSAWWGQKLLMR